MFDPAVAAQQAAMQGNMSQQAAREVSVLLSANTGPYQQEMKKAAGVTDELVDALVRAEEKYKSLLRVMGGGLVGLGATMQASASGAVWSAVRFEENFARVAKTTGLENRLAGQTGAVADIAATFGIGDANLQEFENEIRSLSTQIPVAVEELSYLADVAGTLGVESENLTLFAETAAQLGAGINELGSDQAIAGLANLIGAFGIAQTEVDRLGSSLAELANRTRGNASDMLQFSDRLAGTAVQVGMTADEVLGLGAAISAIGVMPELGASAVTQVMQRISRAVQAGGEDLSRFADAMNMTSDELEEMWQLQGGTSVLVQFIEELAQQGEAASVTLQRLGLSGVNVTQVFGGLAAQIDVLHSAMGISNQAFEEGVAVAELAEIRFGTVIRSLKQFRQSTAEIFRSMGQGFLRTMRMMIDGATNIVNVFNEMPQPLKTSIGLFAALGGTVAIAAGSFLFFFAQFHLFFMTIHMVQGAIGWLIPQLQAMGPHFQAAAGHLSALIERFKAFSNWFKTEGTGEFIGFSGTVQKLARVLKQQLGAALTGVTGVLKWLAGWIRKDIVHAFDLMAMGAGKAAKGVGLLLLPLAKIVAIAGLFSAAIWAIFNGKEAWAEATEEVTGDLEALSKAANLSYESVRRLNNELTSGMDTGEVDLAVEAKDLVDFLKELDEEQAEGFLLRYKMQLLESGSEPEAVQRQIEELARLADQPIVFQYDLEDMRSGQGFQDLREAMAETFEQFGMQHDPSSEGNFSRMWNWVQDRPTPRQEAHFRQGIDQFMSMAQEASLPGRLALYDTARGSIDDAREQGLISRQVQEMLLEEITAMLPDEFGEDDRGWFARTWDDISMPFRPGSGQSTLDRFNPLAPSPTGDLRIDDQREMLAQILEDDTLMDAEHMGELERAVQRVTGQWRDLGDAVRDMDDEELERLNERLYDVQENLNQALIDAQDVREEFDTPLGEILFQAQGLDDAQRRRMLDAAFDAYPQQVGFEQAIEDARHELQLLTDQGDEWGERAERIRRVLQEWGEEFGRIRANEILVDIDTSLATERVQALQAELFRLTDDPWATEVIIEIRQQEHDRAIQEFRQGMQQYDRLIEQRESTIENHDRRMARMDEDHQRRLGDMADQRNKAIEEANKNHARRLEDINDAEKDALEDRVENIANAFSAIQRIQATPTADMGAMLDNMQRQNDAIEEMTSGLSQLRDMGLDQDIIDHLNLDDPRNFAQVRRMLEMSMSDPGLINQINAEWARRLDLTEGLAEESGAQDEIRERFDEQREAANEALDEQIKGINERYEEQLQRANENYARQVDDANENFQRQLESITEALEKLSEDSLESIDDLIERAAESGLEKLEEWARAIREINELMETSITTGQERVEAAMLGQAMGRDLVQVGEFRGAGRDAADEIIAGWRDGAPITWRQLQREIASGTGKAMDSMPPEVSGGVKRSHIELSRISDQDSIWRSASDAGKTGAGRLSSSIVTELERGTNDIDNVLSNWSASIEDHLNPVLESVGADPIEVRTPGGSASDGRRQPGAQRAMAQGGFLPDQATIQSPGTLVQWAEPETGGEAFIPLAKSKRERSRAIWEKTGELLGVDMNRIDPHALHTYADGGFHNIPDMSDLGALGDATEKAMEYVYKVWMKTASPYETRLAPGGDASALSGGGMLWQQMWRVLSEAFPGARLHSAYRPGAITATGNPSYHGMGRAIDVTPSTDIAEWIRQHFMSQTREMIYSPMNHRQIHNGGDHYYATPITRAMHWDHVHWAMAMGDVLTDEMKRGVDNIPAMLSDGEFVMQAKAVKEYGLEQMEAMNDRRFAKGGLVGSAPGRKGREPLGGGQTDLVNALTKALANAQMGRSETNTFGPITVKAQDPNEMQRKLEQKERLKKLAGVQR